MRNDLTANFLAQMAADGKAPIQLLIFHFDQGDVYLSDRDITIDGFLYQGLIESWGELSTTGGIEKNTGTMEQSISIWNGGTFPFSDYFASEDPVNVFVDEYQTFEGLAFEDAAIIGNFVIQDPIEYDEVSQLLVLDLVTTNMRYFGQVGVVMTKDRWPYALESDLNKPIDLIVGDCTDSLALCSNTPARATQSGSILKNPTTIVCVESLNDNLFANRGLIQIDGEVMYYDSRTDSNFNVIIRGYGGSIVSDHSDGSGIIQAGTPVEYLFGLGPISSINNVKVNGQTPTGDYSIHASLDYAVVRFTEQPTFISYSRGARTTESEFDSSAAANTALFPHYSYDNEYKSYGAIIDKVNRQLSIIQNDSPEDDGEVVRVFLAIEHWATELYANDRCDVNVAGIGVVGQLAKPNPADIIDIQAEIDLDHGHDHTEGGIHDHNFINPNINTNDPSHLHGANIAGPTTTTGGEAQGPLYDVGLPYVIGNYNKTVTVKLKWPAKTNVVKQTLKIHIQTNSNADIQLTGGGLNIRWDDVSGSIIQTYEVAVGTTRIDVISRNGSIFGGELIIQYADMVHEYVSSINYGHTGVDSSLTTLGDVLNKNTDTTGLLIKDKTDVDDFAEANRDVDIATLSPSKSIKEKFDLTKHLLTVDWDWLTNRQINVTYVGSTNDAQVVITRVWFEVEYRQRQVKTTDVVTADLVGSIENRPDAVIQYLLTEKAFVPADKLGSVIREVPVWVDSDIWDDLEVWIDEGQVSGVPPGALFEEAAAWFSYQNYCLDGKISGSLTIKEAIADINFQTRSALYWQNGLATLVIKRESDNWAIARDFTTDQIRMRSLKAARSRVGEIFNSIDIYYDLDKLSVAANSGAYRKSATRVDKPSVLKHGEKRDDSLFLFYLIKQEAMAEDISDYYIWELGETRTRYTLDTYIENFDVEKGEYVTINSSGFARIKKLPVNIIDIKRMFGSGKNRQINLFAMVGESIRHYNYIVPLLDEIEVTDNLSILFGFDFEFGDGVNVTDFLLVVEGKEFESEASTSDTLESMIIFRESIPESLAIIGDQTFDMKIDVNLGNTVVAQSDLDVFQNLCFGACGFGCPDGAGVSFGSKNFIQDYPTEYQGVEDNYAIGMDVALGDGATVTDNLVASDGFGCPAGIGDGFGLSPFGC